MVKEPSKAAMDAARNIAEVSGWPISICGAAEIIDNHMNAKLKEFVKNALPSFEDALRCGCGHEGGYVSYMCPKCQTLRVGSLRTVMSIIDQHFTPVEKEDGDA